MRVVRGLSRPLLVTRGFSARRALARPVAATIGNFDGVHRGHQAMVARTEAAARERGVDSCVLTFEPHPRELFTPESAPTRLTSLREKLELLAANGVDRVHLQRFTRAFAALAPEAFVERVLVGALDVRWVLVGDDFRFGARRAGDLAALQAAGAKHGFEVETMPTVLERGVRVSSSAIRDALARGDLAAAAALLGRPFSMSGRVVRGLRLGRELGFATANLPIRHNRSPLSGVFAVRVHGAAETPRQGVASLGVRPTVTSDGRPLLEVHLFDFAGDLYGCHLRVEFLEKLRDEEKYPDLDTLKAQIARDCAAARAVHRAMAARL